MYDDALIDQFAVAKALKVPVVNISFGEEMFEKRDVIAVDRNGKEHEITTVLAEHPAVIEALARGFADNRTLGVASAGRGKYGTGLAGAGASLRLGATDGAQEPCGLRLIERGLTTLLG